MKFDLLPSFWRGMEVETRRAIVDLIDNRGSSWDAELITELRNQFSITLKDLPKLLVCYHVSKEEPECLLLESPSPPPLVPEPEPPVVVQPVTHGLPSFTWKPPGLTGLPLYHHMSRFIRRSGEEMLPSG